MSERTFNVLILCTGNSARSIIAEAVFNTMRDKRFNAYSAGSNPTGVVNPLAIEIAQSIGYPIENLLSKSWDEFAQPDSPPMDFIFTVCDKAAGQTCPVWPGLPMSAHWGFEDPAAFEGTEEQQRKFFFNIFQQIRNRIYAFASLPLATLDRNALQYELNKIGQQSVETQVGKASQITIYHNPACGTSRNVLELIRNTGIEPEVIEYLKTPPNKSTLQGLISAMGIPVRDVLRRNGTPFEELHLDDTKWTDDQLVDFMLSHPILINRPIVVTALGTKLCRPSEAVLDILPAPQLGGFVKEDGEVVVDKDGQRVAK